jgi:hypothetical protein
MAERLTPRRRVRVALEIANAVFWLAVVETGLRRRALPATCRRLGIVWDLDSASPAATERAVLPRRVRTAVLACCVVVARWPAGDTCLRRCLLIGHRLRGLDPVLRIGVRRDADGDFAAHSWLEIGGRTLDPTSADYAPLRAAGRS